MLYSIFVLMLFNDAVSCFGYIPSDHKTIREWVGNIVKRSGLCPRITTKLRLAGLRAEIWSRDLTNVKRECWPLDSDVRCHLICAQNYNLSVFIYVNRCNIKLCPCGPVPWSLLNIIQNHSCLNAFKILQRDTAWWLPHSFLGVNKKHTKHRATNYALWVTSCVHMMTTER